MDSYSCCPSFITCQLCQNRVEPLFLNELFEGIRVCNTIDQDKVFIF